MVKSPFKEELAKGEQQGRGAVPVGKETLQLPLSSASPAFVTRLL